jgi:hypothetical protein
MDVQQFHQNQQSEKLTSLGTYTKGWRRNSPIDISLKYNKRLSDSIIDKDRHYNGQKKKTNGTYP